MAMDELQAQRLAAELFAGSPEPHRDTPTHPPLIGQYEIGPLIGEGASGRVYLAQQASPRRAVAIKVLKPVAAVRSEVLVDRLAREAELLARLRHPGIVQVLEAGTTTIDGWDVPYFAMEYVDGARTLWSFVRDEGLSIRERVRLMAEVCGAVAHACGQGIIHRDLKPSNILVDADGIPRIIDFGIARCADTDVALTLQSTTTGELLGTLQYMSPEQCEGDPAAIGAATDVYALGVILYELLCDELPYDVSAMSIPKATRTIQEVTISPPSTHDRRLRGDLDAIIQQAMAKDPAERYVSAAELGADLERFLRGEPITARPVTLWTRATRVAAQHPVATVATICLLMVLSSAAALGVAIRLTWSRPYAVELVQDGRQAILRSVAWNAIHDWKTVVDGGIRFADFWRPSPATGDRTVVALAFSSDPDNPYPGAVCAFDAAHPSSPPIWMTSVRRSDIPDRYRGLDILPSRFAPELVELRDIFPGSAHPDDEVVIAFNNAGTAVSCIRVIDRSGETLFQTWHDGPTTSVYWLADPGLIIVTGQYIRRFWHEYDARLPVTNQHPVVVYALTPRAGVVETVAAPAWSLWFPPTDSIRISHVTLEPPHPNEDASSSLRLDVVLEGPNAPGFNVVLNADGTIDRSTIVPNNAFDSLESGPDPEDLLPLPFAEVFERYGASD